MSQPQGRFKVSVLHVIVYATMFFFGLVENLKGVVFPLIKTEFNIPYSEQGGLVSLTWFGYVAFCLLASLFLNRYGVKRSLMTGYALVCFGALLTLSAPSFAAVSLALMIINTGFGFFEVGTNAMGTVVFTQRSALMMNLLHFFYGLGAVLGPQIAGWLTDALHYSWRQSYMTIMLPLAFVLLFIAFTKFDTGAKQETEENQPRLTFVGALKSPVVWLFCCVLGFMEVIEFGAANWGGLYLQDVFQLDPRVEGARFVSFFYILFTLSRLFSGMVIERTGCLKSLRYALAASLGLFLLGFGMGQYGMWILPLTGGLIAIMWPTLMAVAMQVFGSDAPVATSAIITVSGAINGLFQLVIGLTNHYIGYAWGYRSCVLYALVALLILRTLTKRVSAVINPVSSPG
jgi:fucose permease